MMFSPLDLFNSVPKTQNLPPLPLQSEITHVPSIYSVDLEDEDDTDENVAKNFPYVT